MFKIVLLLGASLASSMLAAQQPPAQPAPDFLQMQDQMQRELQELQMRAKVLEQRKRVAELEREIAGGGRNATPTGIPGMPGMLPPLGIPGAASMPPPVDLRTMPSLPPMTSAPSTPSEPEKRLLSVFGSPQALRAEVLFAGARMDVGVGETLPQGWRVQRIDASSVVIERAAPAVAGQRQAAAPRTQTRTIGF